jgi:DNA-binding transcriptional LysR family regulator
MQFQRFDLNLLIALDTLLREKNITRAAEKVFVSQPAMSAALHRLRDYFGDPLLVRVGRDMELSPRGQSLVDPVREALLLIQTALGSQPTFTAATTQREFTLIMSEEAVPDLLPAILERVSREAPGIRTNIELISQSALSRLEYGDADLCLCMDSLRLFDVRALPESLRSIQLRPIRWTCVVDRNHPLVGDTLTFEQYLSLPHVFGRPTGYPGSTEQFVQRLLGIQVSVHITVPSLLHLPLVLAGSRLIATMPERISQMFPSTLPVKIFPAPFETEPLHEILLWHKRNETDPAHTWFREVIVQSTMNPHLAHPPLHGHPSRLVERCGPATA